jgi:uncharacterized repeat protein (TIGR01451 family)
MRGTVETPVLRLVVVVQNLVRSAILAAAALVGLATPVLAQGAPSYDWVVNVENEGSEILPAGSLAGYIVTVDNQTSFPAPATVLTVAVPPATTFAGATGTITGCAVAAGVVSCTVPALGPDPIAELVIKFATTTSGVITVVPTIPAPDADPTNNFEDVNTTITLGADIGLSITSPETAAGGSRVNFSITATNFGPDNAETFKFDFPIPSGMGAITAPAGCTLVGSSYNCTGLALNTGASRTFAFSGTIGVGSTSTVTLSTSLLDGVPPDPNSANNSQERNIAVTPGSDVKVSKSRSPAGELTVGQTVTFTLTPSYSGEVPNGLTLEDTLPANYSLVSVTPASGSGWTCTTVGQTVSCDNPSGTTPGLNVPLGTVTLVTTVVSDGTPVNEVVVASAGPFDPDLTNNRATDGGATIRPPSIDLAVRKTGPNPPLVVVGNSYNFALTAQNLGTVGYYGTVQIEELVPAGLTVTAIGGGPTWSCTPPSALPIVGPATIPCQRVYTQASPLAPNATTSPGITVTATATATGTISNGARVTAIGGNLPDLVPENDEIFLGVTGSIPDNSADFSVLKTARNATVNSGEEQVYDLQIVNAGPSAASSVTLIDDLTGLINTNTSGANAGYVSTVSNPGNATGLSCSAATFGAAVRQTCTITSLPVCTVNVNCPTIAITVRPGGNGGSRTNTATVDSPVTADPDRTNNSASATFTVVPRADVTVAKTDTPSPVRAGQNLIYVITARNLPGGLSAAENVTITDILANDLTFISAVASQGGACSSLPVAGTVTGPGNNRIVCNLGSLNSNTQQTVTVTLRPNQSFRGTSLTNTVDVTTTTTDPNLLNNSASVTTAVIDPIFDLLIGKTDSVDPVTVGDDTVYTIRVQNRGPSAAERVVVTDTLPVAFLSYQSVTAPADVACVVAATIDVIGGTITCSIPVLGEGQVRNILLTMRGVSRGVGVNAVEVAADGSATFDSDIRNNSTRQNTTVRNRADVEVTSKVPSTPTPEIGETFTFTVRVTNLVSPGLSEADSVVLNDTLPAGMVMAGSPSATVVNGTTSTLGCSVAGANAGFNCNFGTMSPGAVVDVVAPVRVQVVTPPGPQTFVNTATVTTSSGDQNPANNSNSGSVTVALDLPAIALVKTVSTAALSTPPQAGEVLTYGFTVTNTGGLTLRDVTLADSLPGMVISGGPIAGLAPGAVDATTFTGTYALTQADLDLGRVANSAEVTGNFTTPTGGTDTVTDTSGTAIDNDDPTVIDLPSSAAIAVVKTADISQLATPTQLGDVIIYRFAVTNTGNVTLTNVTLADPLPGLTLTGGPIVALAPGVTDTTTFTGSYAVAQPDFEAQQVVNQATVTGNPPTGPPVTGLSGTSLTNNNPTVVPLTFTPDVTATKTASTDRVIIGDSLTYTLSFTSNSMGTLRDVTVIDVLPVGLAYTPGTATIGGVAMDPKITGRTLRWTGQTIGPKQSLTVKLGVRVTGAAPWGELENQTWLEGSSGARFSNIATAIIVRQPEAVFDCADIIGKVFDDRNRNGTQDAPGGSGATEPGLPAVRVVTTRGYVITTDDFGRFHVPCAELPREMGSNFTMKLDTRSLPTGYRLTTENPRTIRVTPGKMAKVNFGVSLSRVVRIDLSAQAFTAEGQPTAALKKGVAGLIAQLQTEPSVLRLNYRLSGESDAVARKRLDRVEALVRGAWQDKGERLRVERTLQRAGGTP